MILTVPFSYDAEIRRPRKRLFENVSFRDTVEVAVVELTGAEAPVALRYGHNYNPDAAPVETRWDGERFLLPFDWREDDVDVRKDAEWLKATCAVPERHDPEARHRRFVSPFLTEKWVDPSLLRLDQDPQVAQVVSTDRDEEVAKIRKVAAMLVLVDGILWQEKPEPAFVLDFVDFGKTCLGTIRSEHAGFGDKGQGAVSALWMYRLDQLDWIPATRTKLGEGRGVLKVPNVEVLIPSALTLPLTERCLLEAARSMTEEMSKVVAEGTNDYFMAFSALRDAIPVFEKEIAIGELDGADAFSDLLLNAEGAEAARPRESGTYEDSHVHSSVRNAMARLELARMDHDHVSFAGL